MRLSERLGPNGPYLALLLTCFLGWGFKAHCGASWTGAEQYVTGCYSDAVPFWGLRGVAAGQVPYFEARMEYPVLTGALIWIEGLVARITGGARADAADFLNAVVLGNAVLAFVVLEMMRNAGVGVRRQYAWALAPPLVLYVGHNWDLLAVTFAVAAVLAARRGREVRATALAALGAAAKLFPVLLLPLLGLGALLRRGGVLRAATLVVVAVAAWGAVNGPVAAFAFDNWREFYAFSGERSGTAASVWELLGQFGWLVTDIPTRNLWSFLAFAGGAAAITAVGWRRHGERPWLLFMPVLAWFLLTNKVYSPQFDLWLWPFVVLGATRWRPAALFLLGDVAAYFAEFWLFAGMEGAHPSATQADVATAAIVRGVAMLWLIHAAVRDDAPGWVGSRDDAMARRRVVSG
ncbi:hypothetical protein ASG29_07800 [Sphingomonas sp. Leaf412]|uniref:DUF2029 domain-containing protein n=1 Tax=Sphingomonas sp. Leaf412 TaxID=1736370 RepID=UPI0006FCE65F|nr:DUF2029 domain-containing protein [Sphingomonas sp. Leaf412]KQT31804.1 hypothetical protein ASG29_07800 [Sphingomonas sp. Leaf412]